MAPVMAPTLILPREEWLDTDFDLPEGAPLPTSSDKGNEDEDWDMEMDLGPTEGAKAKSRVLPMSDMSSSVSQFPGLINIRPPLHLPDFEDEDDEGISTIKALDVPTILAKPAVKKPLVDPIDEDFEDGFALPSDLTQLSLAPLSLSRRASKNSLEWGDKDNSSSSQSSDAYSTLGFAEASNSTSSPSPSLLETETEEDEDDLEGLVLPSALFESGQSGRQLKKILDTKKKAEAAPKSLKISKADPEDDFEMGLIINDDVDLSPSRLVSNTQHQGQRIFTRSSSIPQRPSTLRPPSRARLERSKSPINPPLSSARQLQKIRLSPSPPLRPPSRSQQSFQALVSTFPTPSASPSLNNNFLSAKPGSLRGQKSQSILKPPTPPSSTRNLTRKASLSSLPSPTQSSISDDSKLARYEVPTAASRAKLKSSTSRIHDFRVPPARPTTPSSNPTALRLTMPTQSRLRSRPALSQVFAGPSTPLDTSIKRSLSPIPPLPQRPPSTTSLRSSAPSRIPHPLPVVPKLLRRPKRPRIYGDGTELDAMEDLPTDREKEVRYRVQPKGFANRIPGATFGSKPGDKDKVADKDTIRKKGKHEGPITNDPPTGPTNTLRRMNTRINFPTPNFTSSEELPKRKKNVSSPNSSSTKRKPTLIRNLGGTNCPKVVGDMRWNPKSLRWEGNEQILRDFEISVGTSIRPALITHLSGAAVGSPLGSLASGARIVGNMVFDPTRMCWVSTLPPDEDEPDVFANLADDEEDDNAWETKGGTIRANVLRISDAGTAKGDVDALDDVSSPASHSRTISESGSERGSRASMVVCDVDDAFIASCRGAEERHRNEMKGWRSTLNKRDTSASDRSYLFEIRALATRKY